MLNWLKNKSPVALILVALGHFVPPGLQPIVDIAKPIIIEKLGGSVIPTPTTSNIEVLPKPEVTYRERKCLQWN